MSQADFGPGRLCLIHNPIAGSGASNRYLKELEAYLEEAGMSYGFKTTLYPGHATELTRAALMEGYTTIAAVGGDGTVREVALGLMDTEGVLAVAPCGTGNDFARPLQIPSDPAAAADVLLYGKTVMLDGAYANDQPYFNVAGFGFDVDVLDCVDSYKATSKTGRIAYLRGLLKAILNFRQRDTVYSIDGGPEVHEDCLLIAAGNGTHFGGGMAITPQADLRDGLLDLCIIHGVKTVFDVMNLLPRFLSGKHLKTKYVTYCKGKSLTARCSPVSRMQVDGERLKGTPVTFSIRQKALRVLVPQSF